MFDISTLFSYLSLQVDEGLPIRKAALTVLQSILEAFAEPQLLVLFDMNLFITNIIKLLSDKDEVKLQIHQVCHE